jgi:AbiV family abortive infection protein
VQFFAEGARKTVENATALNREAKLLHTAGHLSRALFLFQISMEECGKFEILGVCVTQALMGHSVDLKKLRRTISSHASKNRTNAYYLPATHEERKARAKHDFKKASEAFSQMKENFHLKSNSAKNSALYVDIVGDKFVTPFERISAERVAEISTSNDVFLGLAERNLKMLEDWLGSPQVISKGLQAMEKRLSELREKHPDDPFAAFEELMQDLRDPRIKEAYMAARAESAKGDGAQ